MPRTERERIAALAALTAACLVALVFPGVPELLTVLAAILLVLVLPGFALAGALFPGRVLGYSEETMFAAGLSLSASIGCGLVLNLLPAGLTLPGWGALLAALTIAAFAVAWVRTGSRDRMLIPLRLAPLSQSTLAMVGLAAVLVFASLMIARLGEAVQPEPGFTQLWMVPDVAAGAVQLGVANHEHGTEHYRVRVTAGRSRVAEWPDVELADGETWDDSVVLPGMPPSVDEIVAELYRAGDTAAYREVHVHVAEGARATAAPGSPGA